MLQYCCNVCLVHRGSWRADLVKTLERVFERRRLAGFHASITDVILYCTLKIRVGNFGKGMSTLAVVGEMLSNCARCQLRPFDLYLTISRYAPVRTISIFGFEGRVCLNATRGFSTLLARHLKLLVVTLLGGRYSLKRQDNENSEIIWRLGRTS